MKLSLAETPRKFRLATCEQHKPAFPVGLVLVAFLLDARREFLYVLCELLHLVTGSFASPIEFLAGT